MSEQQVFPVSAEAAKRALIDERKYQEMYARSIKDNAGFWGEIGKRVDWIKPYTKVKDVDYTGDVHIRWYHDGTLNVSANCLDRHLAARANQTAIIWEGDDPGESKHITYAEAHEQVCRMANVLKELGAKRGDRITIYMPMIPEAAYAMLACARIGAVHSVVFGGFSPDSLAGRIQDCDSNIVITADEGSARRQEGSAEGQCRRRAEERSIGQEGAWWCAVRAARSSGFKGAIIGGTRRRRRSPPIARRRR